jgi:hypothetical protein
MLHPEELTLVHPVQPVRRLPAVLWPLLLIGLLAPSLIWIAEDRAVWLWDQAWYGEVSVDLWFWMGRSFRHWVEELAGGMSMKPPGVVWLGQLFVPLGRIFGSVEISLLVSILATQFVLLAILYRIGRRLCPASRLGAVAGVTLAAGASVFAWVSHQLLVEPLQAAAVAWVYYVAAEAPRWPRPRVVVELALAMVVGVVAKADTPLYCLLPALYAAALICRQRPSRAEFRAAWKSRAFRLQARLLPVVGGATGLWYYENLRGMLQHVRDASFGAVALDYGHRAPWPRKFVEWSGLSIESFLSPYLGWVFLAVLVGAGFWGMRSLRQRRETRRIEPVAILAALQIPLVLSVLATTIIVEPRFLYALLPAVVIVFVQLCAFLPARLLVAVLVACGAQWAVVNAESLAITGRITHQFQWLSTPEFDGSHYDDLTRVVRLTSDADGRYNIAAVESVWMNANSAAFFAAKNRLRTGVRSYYTSLGYAESDSGKAMRRILGYRTRYVITLAEPFQTGLPAFLNVVSLPVLGEMRNDIRFVQVPFTSRNGVLVFRVQDGQPADAAAGKAF